MSVEIIFKGKPDDDTAAIFQQILSKLAAIEELLMTTDEKIAELVQEVSSQGTVIEGAIALLTGLTTTLEEAKDDPAQLQAVIDQVTAQRDALAAAVQANTPVAPVTPV